MARILVIDDNAAGRELLSVVLRSAGHDVMLAASGEEGMELYRAHRPALVILDVFMPGTDGVEIIEEIRRESKPVKIIATSAGWNIRNMNLAGNPADWDVLQHAVRAGAAATIPKPIDVDLMLEKVDEVLRQPS